jgi:hypothetical protein
VWMQELDRVLDGDDVLGAPFVDQVDHRGQGRRLARRTLVPFQSVIGSSARPSRLAPKATRSTSAPIRKDVWPVAEGAARIGQVARWAG